MKRLTTTAAVHYDVPDALYRSSVVIENTKESYDEVRAAIKRNIALAVLSLDARMFKRFLHDWMTLAAMFRKNGVLTEEEYRQEMTVIIEYPKDLVISGTSAVLKGAKMLADFLKAGPR